MSLRRLVLIFVILTCLTGLLLPIVSLAQADDPQAGITATPQAGIPKPYIPGDTLAPLIVAGLLALIVLGGVLWRSRKLSKL